MLNMYTTAVLRAITIFLPRRSQLTRITLLQELIHKGEGDEAALTCIVHGRPSPEISWSKGGEPLTLDSHVSFGHILHRHTLTISTVTEGDFGDYGCTATNSLGAVTKTLRLTG